MSIYRTWREIMATLADIARCGDVHGHLECLHEVLGGTVRGTDRVGVGFVPPKAARRGGILDMVAQRGRIVNKDIRERFSIESETARLDLAALVNAGALERHGQRRSTWYELAREA